MIRYLHIDHPFSLEAGAVLPRLTIAYSTYGQLNAARDNVIWICHALTANSEAEEWWPGLVGRGFALDPDRYFIICANILGSCYGTTGPDERQPDTGRPYGRDFPLISTRDMARAHELLRRYLGIGRIKLLIGGSLGGQQALEWAIARPQQFDKLCALATNAQHSPWGIAFNEAQRMALLADRTFGTDAPEAGRAGLEAARAIAMLSYRHYRTYETSQQETDADKLDGFRAASYQRYQGYKLWKRFSPLAYYSLSKTMDAHHVGRGRGSIAEALAGIQADTLVIGIDTDVLFPLEEQALLTRYIPSSRLEVIHSDYGHDGFLTEAAPVGRLLEPFLTSETTVNGSVARSLTPTLPGRRFAIPGTEKL